MAALLTGALYTATALKISDDGILAIQSHEGYRNIAYRDQANVLTVCYGSTRDVHPNRRYSDSECKERLHTDIRDATGAISRNVGVPLTQGQYDALSDFVYQFGEAKFRSSTLLKKLNAWDCWGASQEFNKWKYVQGVVNLGVQKRREENARQFSNGCKTWDKYGL